MKKLHSTIKQLTLLICMFCTTSTFADDGGTCGENITWTYVEATKTLTISGSGKMSVGNYPWSKYRTDISKVVIENGVTSIGSSAFADCANLYSITIPNSVVNVGSNAFQGIKIVIWLTNTPPSGWKYAKGTVNYVPNNQFGTTNDIIVYPFLSSLFEVDGVKYVPVSPSERTCDAIDCVYDESKTEVNINNFVTYQGIDMKVMNIQPYTFYQNPYLQKVNLDVSGRLSRYALSNCPKLQIALLGNNVTNIDDYAFSNCQKLESIIIPDAVNDIGQYAFSDCSNMTSVHIGDGTSTIGQYAFSGCLNMTSVHIGNGTSTIGQYAFSGCLNMTSVHIGNGTSTIGQYAFYQCSNLTSLDLGNKTRLIQQYAFSGCSSLPKITLPGSVHIIDDYAFEGCTALKEVVMDKHISEDVTTSFDDSSLSFSNIDYGSYTMLSFMAYEGDEVSFDYSIEYGTLNIAGVFITTDSSPKRSGYYKTVIKKSGRFEIHYSKGKSCKISNIKLADSDILAMGSHFFKDCPLDSICINRKVSNNDSPFEGNTTLRSVVITELISEKEFFGCTNLQNVQIGDGVTSIGDWAFSGCSSLKSFSFGINVRNIGKEAFSDCTSLTQLTSHATTPPICGKQALDDINKWTCKLTVPYGCIGIYQTADQWKEFFFIEEGEKTKEEIAINEENFPDENFRSWLLSQSYGSDGLLTDEEIAGVSKISVYGESIQSLKGIEYFTALTHLDCSLNQLTSIDVSENIALTYLNCYNNKITSLDFSKNKALISLNCCRNKITSLDVSKYTALTYLNCEGNQITSLDVSKNSALTGLNCSLNQLTSLDVSKNTALTSLNCGHNQITSLDVSKNIALTSLDCSSNQLTSLDVSKNTALTSLDCGSNQLTSLDFSKNTALISLNYCRNQLTSLDVSKYTALIYLNCEGNQITSLDVSNNTALTELWCGSNQLTSLDVSNNTALKWLYCSSNQLTSLDVSKNTALISLDCGSNQLTSLDVSKNTALHRLYCSSNQLTSLDVSKKSAPTGLACYQNRIKGDGMDALITCLPLVSNSTMYVIYNENEQNVMTSTQVAAAKAKGWRPLYYDGTYWMEYVGSDPSGIQGIMLDKKVNVPIYDLNGRRLTEPQKGINIIGGKKVFVK